VALTRSSRFDALLTRLGIERRSTPPPEAGVFVLFEADAGLELRPPGELDRAGIRAHFPPDRRPASQPLARDPLAKAFGKKISRLYDGTAGLGADAYRLAAAGYRVQGSERHSVVYALLASAWDRACDQRRVPAAIADRLSFEWLEAERMLDGIDGRNLGVYLDPMYPPSRRRSALPKRGLQVLRDLIGQEDEPVALVARARQRAARVVVKRPHHAAPLMDDIGFSVETKLVRFDVYLNPERMEASS